MYTCSVLLVLLLVRGDATRGLLVGTSNLSLYLYRFPRVRSHRSLIPRPFDEMTEMLRDVERCLPRPLTKIGEKITLRRLRKDRSPVPEITRSSVGLMEFRLNMVEVLRDWWGILGSRAHRKFVEASLIIGPGTRRWSMALRRSGQNGCTRT